MLEHRQPSCIEAPMMSSTIKTVPFQPPKKQQKLKEDAPWHQYLTIDLVWYVLGYTIFHPFVSWIVVLCLRAQYTKYEAPEMRIAIAWSMAMSVIGIFGIVSDRIAFGPHREVDLSEEVIVITGGVDGLGGLLADTYGMRNAMVAVLDVKTVDKAEAEAKGVSYYQCDVGDAHQVEAAAARIVKDLGPPTILINNAGIVHTKSIIDSTAAEVEQAFRVNTLSHFTTLRTFLPHMIAQGCGTIVTVSSVLGHLGAANLSSYCASKAALLALHHSLRAELAQIPGAEDIKTILVQPGQMSTKMFEHVHAPSKFFGPLVTPAEMAQGIIRLVDRGESGEVALPLYSRYIQVLGCLPFGIQHIARRWSGLDTAVDVGRAKTKKEVPGKS